RVDRGLHLLGEDFIRRGRRDLRPSPTQPDGLTQALGELLFAVVVPPAAALVELDEIGTAFIGERAPFQRNLLEHLHGMPCRHREAVASCWSRRVIVSLGRRTSNDRLPTRHRLCPDYTTNRGTV